MGQTTGIAWTDSTWSPLRARIRPDALEIAETKGYTSLVQVLTARKPNGELRSPAGKVGPHCEHVSPGCENCYSEFNGKRCLPANGTGLPFDRRARDLVEIFLDEKILVQPLHWKRPRRIFVNSQTDSFAEFVTDAMIDRMMLVALMCPQHTFQFLTKRAQRMEQYMRLTKACAISGGKTFANALPLSNVWLGVSAEDQQRADERIPWLLKTPAAKRFVSCEPALGLIDLTPYLGYRAYHCKCGWHDTQLDLSPEGKVWRCLKCFNVCEEWPGLSWVICGGESGRGARPSQLEWYRSVIEQCKATDTACFVKQFGKHPHDGCLQYACESDPGHGANPMDWPREYRIQEFPA